MNLMRMSSKRVFVYARHLSSVILLAKHSLSVSRILASSDTHQIVHLNLTLPSPANLQSTETINNLWPQSRQNKIKKMDVKNGIPILATETINNRWPRSGQNKNKKIDVKNGIRTHALSDH